MRIIGQIAEKTEKLPGQLEDPSAPISPEFKPSPFGSSQESLLLERAGASLNVTG